MKSRVECKFFFIILLLSPFLIPSSSDSVSGCGSTRSCSTWSWPPPPSPATRADHQVRERPFNLRFVVFSNFNCCLQILLERAEIFLEAIPFSFLLNCFTISWFAACAFTKPGWNMQRPNSVQIFKRAPDCHIDACRWWWCLLQRDLWSTFRFAENWNRALPLSPWQISRLRGFDMGLVNFMFVNSFPTIMQGKFVQSLHKQSPNLSTATLSL